MVVLREMLFLRSCASHLYRARSFFVSGGDFGGPVSASKNSVPVGQGSEQTCGFCRTGERPRRRWQRPVFWACAIVADSTQALRTADSIPPEHRAVARC